MTIPKSRDALVHGIESSFAKLLEDLDRGGPRLGNRPCVDDWTVKELLSVRAWWSEAVVRWIQTGRQGEHPVTPAESYRWRDTPRLNQEIVRRAARVSYKQTRARLERAYAAVMEIVAKLDDQELLTVGRYPWAGNYPLARWLSMNTTRQYRTARTMVRRVIDATT